MVMNKNIVQLQSPVLSVQNHQSEVCCTGQPPSSSEIGLLSQTVGTSQLSTTPGLAGLDLLPALS